MASASSSRAGRRLARPVEHKRSKVNSARDARRGYIRRLGSRCVAFALGAAMSFDEAAMKFRGCAEFVEWPKAKTEKLVTYVKELDSVLDVSALSPLLSAEKG